MGATYHLHRLILSRSSYFRLKSRSVEVILRCLMARISGNFTKQGFSPTLKTLNCQILHQASSLGCSISVCKYMSLHQNIHFRIESINSRYNFYCSILYSDFGATGS
ncbi:hypothetical protein HanPI659440_Chr08g0280561 [Helianthus annuus]|nr:hypothetical protein HanPI659440_Chr08g0280561 [Helianthus annuus]